MLTACWLAAMLSLASLVFDLLAYSKALQRHDAVLHQIREAVEEEQLRWN